MKKNHKILSLIIVFLISFACQREDINNLRDVFYVRYKGSDMPAYVHGNGSNNIFIIYLHGGPGGNGLTYRTLAFSDYLEKEYAVVYFDQRGAGMAQGNYSMDKLNIDIMAEDIIALVQVLKRKYGSSIKLFLMGHSWGGALGSAVICKEKQQHLFKGWIEIDGLHDFVNYSNRMANNFFKVGNQQISNGNDIAFWKDLLSYISKNIDTSTSNLNDISYLNKKAFEAEDILKQRDLINPPSEDETNQTLINGFFRNNFTTTTLNLILSNSVIIKDCVNRKINYTPQLHKITIPTLFLWGKYDMIVPDSIGIESFQKVQSLKKKILSYNYSGHSPMVSEPNIFYLDVSKFIEENK